MFYINVGRRHRECTFSNSPHEALLTSWLYVCYKTSHGVALQSLAIELLIFLFKIIPVCMIFFFPWRLCMSHNQINFITLKNTGVYITGNLPKSSLPLYFFSMVCHSTLICILTPLVKCYLSSTEDALFSASPMRWSKEHLEFSFTK